MIHTGFESYTVQELADRMPEGPLYVELVRRLQAREDLAADVQNALAAARTVEEQVRDLATAHSEDTADVFFEALHKRVIKLLAACEEFKDADPGE